MPNKPTITAAIIEANRAKNPIRHVIDYDHRARCMDVLIDAAQYRIKRMLVENEEGGVECPACGTTIDYSPIFEEHFCYNCGQALDWSK